MERPPRLTRDIYSDCDFRGSHEDLGSTEPARLLEAVQKITGKFGIDLTGEDIRVLEAGSGDARFLDYAKQHGVNIIGVDIRPRVKGSEELPQVLARIEQLPFDNETFTVVFARGLFDPIYSVNERRMMEEIFRVLKLGGLFISDGAHSDPFDYSMRGIEGFNLVSGKYGPTIYRKSQRLEKPLSPNR